MTALSPEQSKRIAAFGLHVVSQATVRADDQTQQDLTVLKAWLRAIVGDKLLVMQLAEAPVETAAQPPP